jgi:hypothetical protein
VTDFIIVLFTVISINKGVKKWVMIPTVDQIVKPKGHLTWIRLMEPLGELDEKARVYGLPE